jgi:hypothetical protein
MPRSRPFAFNYHPDAALWEALVDLARANGRPIHSELDHAVRRHLASPPALVTPPLADAPAPAPKRRGRPRKAG